MVAGTCGDYKRSGARLQPANVDVDVRRPSDGPGHDDQRRRGRTLLAAHVRMHMRMYVYEQRARATLQA